LDRIRDEAMAIDQGGFRYESRITVLTKKSLLFQSEQYRLEIDMSQCECRTLCAVFDEILVRVVFDTTHFTAGRPIGQFPMHYQTFLILFLFLHNRNFR
ncbi:hypothetical protein, partial [Carnobacterium antarcticum]